MYERSSYGFDFTRRAIHGIEDESLRRDFDDLLMLPAWKKDRKCDVGKTRKCIAAKKSECMDTDQSVTAAHVWGARLALVMCSERPRLP